MSTADPRPDVPHHRPSGRSVVAFVALSITASWIAQQGTANPVARCSEAA